MPVLSNFLHFSLLNIPKIEVSKTVKVRQFEEKYPSEFTASANSEHFCKKCERVVLCEKQFHVEQHRQTLKHQRLISAFISQSQLQLPTGEKVVQAFVAADIPL